MTVRIIPILVVAIMIGPLLAYGSPACMTESEARAKFPKAHLIWLGTDHCWTFGVAPVHSRRPVLAAEPVPSLQPLLAAYSRQSRCLPHDPNRRQSPCLPHDPKSLTAISTQERNADIRHVSRKNGSFHQPKNFRQLGGIRRDAPRLIVAEELGHGLQTVLFVGNFVIH